MLRCDMISPALQRELRKGERDKYAILVKEH